MGVRWLVCVVLALGPMASAGAEEGRRQVVATNSILADWIANVGRERVEVHTLVAANGDVHTFEPTPQDGIRLGKADAVISFGLGLEPWLADLLKSSGSKAHRYTVTDGLVLIRLGKAQGMFRDEVDQHFWHDPTKAAEVIQKIATVFVNEDPSNAQFYWQNARDYIEQLAKLDAAIAKQIQKIPPAKRKIVTSHDTFAYFAKRYGFKVVGSIIDSSSTEAADPSAKDMAVLIQRVKDEGVPAVFLENVHNPKTAEAVAREAGVKLAPELYSDALGEPGSPAETYIKMMMYNTGIFVEQLRS